MLWTNLTLTPPLILVISGLILVAAGGALLIVSFYQRREIRKLHKEEEKARLLEQSIHYQDRGIERLQMLLLAMPDALFTTDASGCIDYWNEHVETLTGYGTDDAMGKQWNVFLTVAWGENEGGDSRQSESLPPVLSNRECRLATRSGMELIVLVSSRGIHDAAGEVSGSVTVIKDITPIKELEQRLKRQREDLRLANARLEELARQQSRFLSHVSHELRTPLNSILGFTGILLDELTGPLNEEQSRQLKVIYRQSQRLLEQINQLLEAARIESGRLTFDPRNFSVPPVILDVIDSMEPLAREKNLELRFERPVEPVPDVYADPWRVEQILINLLSNAIKYTETGKVWVECGVCRDEPVPRLEIRVCDSGIGIEADEQQRMFEEFWQSNSARSKTRSGLGLGLAITKRLVEMQQGSISVQSKPGEGTIVAIRLPVRAEVDSYDPNAPCVRNEPVRVVAEDPIIAHALIRLLAMHGIGSVWYASRSDLERCGANRSADYLPPRVLLVDEPMWPDVQKLFCQPRTEGGGPAPVCVILTLDREASMTGAPGEIYLRKPVTAKSLMDLLEQSLASSPSVSDVSGALAEVREDKPNG